MLRGEAVTLDAAVIAEVAAGIDGLEPVGSPALREALRELRERLSSLGSEPVRAVPREGFD